MRICQRCENKMDILTYYCPPGPYVEPKAYCLNCAIALALESTNKKNINVLHIKKRENE